MVASVNIGLELPTRGSNVGTWDTPVNGDFSILDQAFGSITTIALSSNTVTLATSQAQNAVIRLTGTINTNVALICAPIYKFWTIDNQITNSPSSFCVTMFSTSGLSLLGLPPGTQDVFYDGTTLKYKNLGKLGEYWDYAGATVPSWVNSSTIPPYLNCNGTTFSSAVYPQLANLLGSNTLPDSRGRYRANLNQTTSRITSSGGVDGDTNYASGGIQNKSITIGSSNLPNSIPVKDPGHLHGVSSGTNGVNVFPNNGAGGVFSFAAGGNGAIQFSQTGTAVTGITVNPSTAGAGTDNPFFFTTLPPSYVGGITMIRAGV